jgi:hypothetical protein
MPSGQASTEFESTTLTDKLVIFANPSHDFPQRVIYENRGADSLYARVEAELNGVVRQIPFRYSRVPCNDK